MDDLRKLEEAQRALSCMRQRGLSSDNHDSNRFLSDFLLFMAKPCGNLKMEEKCHLISQHLPEISSQVLEGTQFFHSREEYNAQHSTEDCLHSTSDLCSLRADIEGLAVVGLDAMKRANSTLEDFCRSYYMFHGMDVSNPQSVFRFLPVLSFAESYIYQLDNLNEKIINLSAERISSDGTSKLESDRSLTDHLADVFKTNPFRPLIHILECSHLLTERIRAELMSGEEYWNLERKLCLALKSKKKIMIEDVMRAIHLKSFDYRVLNLLLYQLRGEQVNDMHMEFLSVSEFLVEISDDLFDYEDDVLDNNFNILRMFVRIYGASMAPVMLAKCITEAEDKYVHLLKTLDPDLSLNYQKRCEEATREGGNMAGHSLGTWTIPRVIADEELYTDQTS